MGCQYLLDPFPGLAGLLREAQSGINLFQLAVGRAVQWVVASAQFQRLLRCPPVPGAQAGVELDLCEQVPLRVAAADIVEPWQHTAQPLDRQLPLTPGLR